MLNCKIDITSTLQLGNLTLVLSYLKSPASKAVDGSRIQAPAFLTPNPVLVPSLHSTLLDVDKGGGPAWVLGHPHSVGVVGVWGCTCAHSAQICRAPTVAGPVGG